MLKQMMQQRHVLNIVHGTFQAGSGHAAAAQGGRTSLPSEPSGAHSREPSWAALSALHWRGRAFGYVSWQACMQHGLGQPASVREGSTF